MILNRHVADPSHLRLLILSCPKTGNTWLRWLLHYAYSLEIADLPADWSTEAAAALPDAFVSHQHLWPREDMVQWLVDNGVTVLTTVRHPGDTLLSYFHFAKWQDLSTDPAAAAMAKDGERPGKRTLEYARYAFAQAYSLSLAWARLGAHVVRYEDLLRDPVARLTALCERIAPVDAHKIRAAVMLCKPEHMTAPGLVDPRHIRTGRSRGWAKELPTEIVETLARTEPFESACRLYGYDWSRTARDPAPFDYDTIDAFRGEERFDNGEIVGPSLQRIYLHEAGDASRRWPDPVRTEGDSFWNWLVAPSEDALLDAERPPGTYTHLMAAVYRMRPDLQEQYPDPAGRDRTAYLAWFIGRAAPEFRFPWGLVAPLVERYCDALERMAEEHAAPLGRIERIAIRDAQGNETDAFACGDEIDVAVELAIEAPVVDGVIGFSLRSGEGRLVFGTNTTLLGTPLPELAPGRYVAHIRSRLTIPPQACYVAVGLARYVAAGRAEAIHRRYDVKRITVGGAPAAGTSWCAASIAIEPRPAATESAEGPDVGGGELRNERAGLG